MNKKITMKQIYDHLRARIKKITEPLKMNKKITLKQEYNPLRGSFKTITEPTIYRVKKYLDDSGNEKYTAEIHYKLVYENNDIYKEGYCLNNPLLNGLDSFEEVEKRIKQIEECKNYIAYITLVDNTWNISK